MFAAVYGERCSVRSRCDITTKAVGRGTESLRNSLLSLIVHKLRLPKNSKIDILLIVGHGILLTTICCAATAGAKV
jgi:hypothetical protein